MEPPKEEPPKEEPKKEEPKREEPPKTEEKNGYNGVEQPPYPEPKPGPKIDYTEKDLQDVAKKVPPRKDDFMDKELKVSFEKKEKENQSNVASALPGNHKATHDLPADHP